jgi:Tol biopolymer transport system component
MKLRSKAAVVGTVVIAAAALVAAVTHASAAKASASPTNGQLAWDPCPLENPCPAGRVAIANPDGTARRTLHMPWQSNHPVWSPDGSRLLVTAIRPNLPDRPATMNPDGSRLTLLDPGHPDLNLDCNAWSPDGTRLLCAGISDQETLNGIYTIRASDGGDLTRLTTSPSGSYDAAPEYSPDGTRLAFIRAPGDNGALFVANADGSGLHQITADLTLMAGDYGGVAWSPDGTEIIFTTAHWSLDTIHPDGTSLREVFHGEDGCPCFFSPTWSPDGTHIAYADNPNHSFSNIYTANADGTHRVQVTGTSVGEGWPSWGTHPLAPKCTAAEKASRARAVATYKRQMAAARRAYFRTHHGSKARAAFVKAQRAKLKALERRLAACTGP